MRQLQIVGSSLYVRQFVVLLAALFVAVVSAHAQTLTVLHSFMSRPDGLTSVAGVIMDQFGNLYGTRMSASDTAILLPFQTRTGKTLSFTSTTATNNQEKER
jgi:hypothetical protein